MTRITAITTALLLSSASLAFPHQRTADPLTTSAVSNAQRVEALLQGKGSPGDSVTSVSDPNVTFTVMENGLVERRNDRYDTVQYIRPLAQWERGFDYRGGR
ncbi:MAG: hypothetical protein ABJG86_17345 [Nitratireductor sp.]|jgi:mevalonate kinase|uniref:hypothetical protein n=1 Tax=Alphaproteobacteria TaxID=28211 RepID=UPI0032659623